MPYKADVDIMMKLKAREVLDSRGNPTVEVDLSSDDMLFRAMVPSGASTGTHEALELRDGDKRYHGKGVLKAVDNINRIIAPKISSLSPDDQEKIDNIMLKLDGTDKKQKLGANALLAVSMAVARAASFRKDMPLYSYLAELSSRKPCMPVPFANIINGGKHAGGKLAMQEFMIAPINVKSFSEAARITSETYHELKSVIKKRYGTSAVNVGDEGGFAPPIDTASQAIDLILQAVEQLGYTKQVKVAMDPAASEFYKDGKYNVEKSFSPSDMVDYYLDLIKTYPICSLEDPFAEDDFDSFAELTEKTKIQIVADDLTVTNTSRIKEAIKKKACNALLLKVNQIGTLTESIDAARLSFENSWNVMVSHRSGETEDPFIADLAVGLGCRQIKLGAPCRSDRTSKYNQLLRLEEEHDLTYSWF